MIDTDKYEGHTPAYAWRRADGSAMFMQSANNNADAELMADAPLLFEHVKRLTKTLELIAKEMPYDYWLHTLINDVIGYEKWQAKEMIE